MNMRRKFRITLLALLLIFGFADLSLAKLQTEKYKDIKTKKEIEIVKEELLVKFKPGLAVQKQKEILKTYRLTIKKSLEKLKWHLVKIPKGKSIAEVIEKLKKNPNIISVEPNIISRIFTTTPSDTYYNNQWGIKKIECDKSWDIEKGSANVTIAVLDTGIDLSHSDLKDNLVSGYDFVNLDNNPQDDNGHGTEVAGIIGAKGNNGIGIAGVIWNSKLMPVKVVGSDGYGTYFDVGQGLIYASDNGAKVINLSIGGYGWSDMLKEAIDYTFNRGCILVAAVGNDNTNIPIYPAAFAGVIGVSATDSNDVVDSNSNYGEYADISAPGVGIYSTYLNNTYKSDSGSSMACAHVSGVIALMLSIKKELTREQIESLLYMNTDPVTGTLGKNYGHGRINAYKTISNLIKPHNNWDSPHSGTVPNAQTIDIAITSMDITPTQFKVGEPVNVVVTVENKGKQELENIQLILNKLVRRDEKTFNTVEIGRSQIQTINLSEKIQKQFTITIDPAQETKIYLKAEIPILTNETFTWNNSLSREYNLKQTEDGIVKILHAEIVHQYIAVEAAKVFGQDTEIGKTIKQGGYLYNDKTIDDWRDDRHYDENGNVKDLTIAAGAYDEDHTDHIFPYYSEATLSIRHFWDADAGDDSPGLFSEIFPFHNENAYQKSVILWKGKSGSTDPNVLNLYKSNKAEAYELLGHVVHLLEDMGMPAHVHMDPHFLDDDCYEDWEQYYPQIYKWTYQDAINAGGLINIPWENRPTEIGKDVFPLYYLFYTVNQTADHFASDDYDGDDNDRRGWMNYTGWAGPIYKSDLKDNDTDWLGLFDYDNDDDGDLTKIGNGTVPYTIRAVATLYKFFWDALHPPQCTVESPKSGEHKRSVFTITAKAITGIPRVEKVEIEYSLDNKNTWIPLSATLRYISDESTEIWGVEFDSTGMNYSSVYVRARFKNSSGIYSEWTESSFVIDNTPPTISEVSSSPNPFSPNQDNKKDTTNTSYSLSDNLSPRITTTIKLQDVYTNIVRTLQQTDSLILTGNLYTGGPFQQVWDGKGSIEFNNGVVVSDGIYTVIAEATDLAGNVATLTDGTITLVTKPPEFVTNPYASPFIFTPLDPFGVKTTTSINYTISDKFLNKVYTTVEVFADPEATILKKKLADNVTLNLTYDSESKKYIRTFSNIWNGRDEAGNVVEDGAYTVRIKLIDDADNVAINYATVVKNIIHPDISSPLANSTLNGKVNIIGTAVNPLGFAGYRVGYAPAGTSSWTYLVLPNSYWNNSTGNLTISFIQITDGTLAEWDTREVSNGVYDLKLVILDSSGNPLDETKVANITVNNAFNIYNISANLFSPNSDGIKDTTTITYYLPASTSTTVEIYNSNNQLVNTLFTGTASAGKNTVVWDGAGATVDGIYTCRITSAGMTNSPQSVNIERITTNANIISSITIPVTNDTISGTIEIIGSANNITTTNFESYKLEYGVGASPSSWTQIITSTTVSSGRLGVLDTTALNDGQYTIKLTVLDKAGNSKTSNLVTINASNIFYVTLSANPENFSPDGDGVRDYTSITYSLSKNANTVSLGIYDASNNKTKTFSPVTTKGIYKINWTGDKDTGGIAEPGRYTAKFEATGVDGTSATKIVQLTVDIKNGPNVIISLPINNTNVYGKPYFSFNSKGNGLYDLPKYFNWRIVATGTQSSVKEYRVEVKDWSTLYYENFVVDKAYTINWEFSGYDNTEFKIRNTTINEEVVHLWGFSRAQDSVFYPKRESGSFTAKPWNNYSITIKTSSVPGLHPGLGSFGRAYYTATSTAMASTGLTAGVVIYDNGPSSSYVMDYSMFLSPSLNNTINPATVDVSPVLSGSAVEIPTPTVGALASITSTELWPPSILIRGRITVYNTKPSSGNWATDGFKRYVHEEPLEYNKSTEINLYNLYTTKFLYTYPFDVFNIHHTTNWIIEKAQAFWPDGSVNSDIVLTDVNDNKNLDANGNSVVGSSSNFYKLPLGADSSYEKIKVSLRPASATIYESKTFIKITGTANISGFTKYKLEYGAGENPLEWKLITESNTKVIIPNGVLGYWDVTRLNGTYSLLLTVFNTTIKESNKVTVRIGQTISTAKDSLIADTYKQAQIVFPTGSLTSDKIVTVSRVNVSEVPLFNTGFTPVGPIFWIQPGLTSADFVKDANGNVLRPATLTLKYNESELPVGIDESTMGLYRFNPVTGELKFVPSVIDRVNNIITAQITEFSYFLVLPELKPQLNVSVIPEATTVGDITIKISSSKPLKEVPTVKVTTPDGKISDISVVLTSALNYEYEGKFYITSGLNGVSLLGVTGVDFLNNVGTAKRSFIIDTTPPVTNISNVTIKKITTKEEWETGIQNNIDSVSSPGEIRLNRISNKALEFDGVNNYVSTLKEFPITGAQERTLMAWVKFDEVPKDKLSVAVAWGWEGDGYNQPDAGLFSLVCTGYSPSDRFGMWGILSGDVWSNTRIPLGIWNHLVATYDGKDVSLYLNGVLDKVQTVRLNTLSSKVKFGKKMGDFIDRMWFKGSIDEVAIYNRVLNADEIMNSYIGIIPTLDASTVGLWHFDERSGTTLKDSSQYHNDGNIYGAIWTETEDRGSYYTIGIQSNIIVNEIIPTVTGIFTVIEEKPAGTDITYRIAYSDDGNNYTSFTTIVNNSSVEPYKYTKVEATLTTTDPSVTPVLKEISIKYPVPANIINGVTYLDIENIYLEAFDTGTGIKEIRYRIDEQNWQSFTGEPFNISADVIHTIDYFSIDNVNNTEDIKTIYAARDKDAPVTVVLIGEPKYSEVPTYVRSNTSLTLTATDNVSGVLSTKYGIDKVNGIIQWNDYTQPFSISAEEGLHTVYYRSIDRFENIEDTKSTIIYLDNTVPVTNIANAIVKNVTTQADWEIGISVNTDTTTSSGDVKLGKGPGKALYFDGVDDYIDLERPENLKIQTFSISLWVKPPGHLTNYPPLVSWGKNGWGVGVEASTNKIHVSKPWVGGVLSTGTISLSNWSHLVFICEDVGSTKRVKMYINGEYAGGSDSFNQVFTFTNSWNKLRIGTETDGTTWKYFTGSIDEVLIYNKVLNETEINDLYNKRVISGVVSYWRFEEGSSTVVNDSVGINNGLIYGATWVEGIEMPVYVTTGTQTNILIHDVVPSNSGKFIVEEEKRAGTDITYRIAYSDDGNNYTSFTTIVNNSSVEPHKYTKVEATLTTIDPSVTPVLKEISIKYPVQGNVIINEIPYVNYENIDFTVSDIGSGVKEIKYRIDNGMWQNFTTGEPFSVSLDVIHTINYYSIDNLNNTETIKTVYTKDTIPPVTTITIGTPKYERVQIYVTSGTLFALATDDDISRILKTEYQIDNGNWNIYTEPFIILSEGQHSINYRSIDKDGNTEEVKSMTVVVDNTTPVTNIANVIVKKITTQAEWEIGISVNTDTTTSSGDVKLGKGPGKALKFDGVDDYIDIPGGSFNFNRTDNYSLEFWFKTTFIDGNWRTPIVKRVTGGAHPFGSEIEPNTGKVQCTTYSGGTDWWGKQSSVSVVDGNWHHVVMVHYSNSTFDAFLDGVKLTVHVGSKSFPETGSTANSENLRIGSDTSLSRYFNGTIDEVGIYNRALSVDEVMEHYQKVVSSPDVNTVALWHFEEGSGRILKDNSQYHNDGNIQGAVWTEGVPGYFATGIQTNIIVNETIPSNSGIFTAIEEKPAGTDITYKIAYSDDGTTYTNFIPVVNGGTIEPHKYTKVEATLSATIDLSVTPILKEIALVYIKPAALRQAQGENTVVLLQPYYLSLSANDNASGIKEANYKIDEGELQKYQISSTIPAEIKFPDYKTHYLTYYSVDNVGNTEAETKVRVIQDSMPSTTVVNIGEPKYSGLSLNGDYAQTYITKDTPLTLSAIDDLIEKGDKSGLGVGYIEYWINNQSKIKFENSNPGIGLIFTTSEIKLLTEPEGENTLYYTSTDIVGNKEEIKSEKVIIDNTPPVTAINISEPKADATSVDPVGSIIISYRTEISLDATDNASGVAKTEYRIISGTVPFGDSPWNNYTTSFKLTNYVDGIYTIEYKSVDNVRNIEEVKKQIVVLDTIKPVAKILSPSKETLAGICSYYNGEITIVGTVTDLHFDYYKLEYGAGENPSEWAIIWDSPQGTVPIIEGVLAKLDTTNLVSGVYTIRLTAVDEVKNNKEDKVTITIGTPELQLVLDKNLNHPKAVALDKDGYIYVADTNNDCIKKYDTFGNFITIGETNQKKHSKQRIFNKPSGIYINEENYIYISDTNNDRIKKMTQDGTIIQEINKFNLNKPHGLKLNKGYLYVADRNNDVIRKYDLEGNLITNLCGGDLNKPEDVFITNEFIYVANRNMDNIRIFNLNGGLIKTIGKTGELNPSASSGLCKPSSVYVCANEDIFISDTNNDRIVRYDKYGNLQFSLKNRVGPQGTVPVFNKPSGITVDKEGNLYVADTNNSRVLVYGNGLSNLIIALNVSTNTDNSNTETEIATNHEAPGLMKLNKQVADRINKNSREKENKEKNKIKFGKVENDKLKELGKLMQNHHKKFRDVSGELKQHDKELREKLKVDNLPSYRNENLKPSIFDKSHPTNHIYQYVEIKDKNTGELIWHSNFGVHKGEFKDLRKEYQNNHELIKILGKDKIFGNNHKEKEQGKPSEGDKGKAGGVDQGQGGSNQGGQGNQGNQGNDKDKDNKGNQGNNGNNGNQGNNGNEGNNGNQGNNGNNNNQDKGKGKK